MAESEQRIPSEYDTIEVFNPLDEEFATRFNGEIYRVPAKSGKFFPTFLAMHVAKKLSDKILEPLLVKLKKDSAKTDKSPFNPLNAQLMIYDNPERRISLYRVLRSKERVQACIQNFPFKGFIGEMSEYEKFVAKETSTEPTPKVKKEE